MTVYVDNSRISATVQNGGRKVSGRWCHLFAHPDDVAELHEVARRIGMRRSWFQDHHRRPEMWHYDLVESRRAAAVRLGVVEVSWREGARLMRSWWEARDAVAAQGHSSEDSR